MTFRCEDPQSRYRRRKKRELVLAFICLLVMACWLGLIAYWMTHPSH